MKILPSLLLIVLTFLRLPVAAAAEVKEVTQYGITWTFDKPHQVGQFITGDYWVIGPVNVVSVSPAPATASAGQAGGNVKSKYGAVSMVADERMRNGSMIVLKSDQDQGYDSRMKDYKPALSVVFPCALPVNQSLISTISNGPEPVTVLLADLMWAKEKTSSLALKSAAVLTCLSNPPPLDAFRPPFAGPEKPIYQLKDVKWDILPRLAPAGPVPSWEKFERYLQRPWLDHVSEWFFQNMGPNENNPNYGREFSRVGGIAALMLMLDVPKEKKEKLAIGMIQWGIDAAGLAKTGRVWIASGGHWNGRKFPILFAGLMLGDKEMQEIAGRPIFSEDFSTYYGKGFYGQTTMYQIGVFGGPNPLYEETDPATWDWRGKRSEGYRTSTVSPGWPGTALAVQLLKAKALWNHDAFFDYNDRWMSKADPYASTRGAYARPKQEGASLDPFVDAMWLSYRKSVPQQPGAKDNLKWVWTGQGNDGKWVPNPPTPR